MTSHWPSLPATSVRDAVLSGRLDSFASTLRPEILLCDPIFERNERIKSALAGCGRVVCHSKLTSAHLACELGAPAIVLLPFDGSSSPETTAVLEFIRTFARHAAILVYADTSQLPIAVYCRPLAAGARQILNSQSPTFLEDVTAAVDRLTHDLEAQFQEHHQLGEVFASFGLLARSAPMREVFRRAIKASHFSDLPLLILGETGTGKQRLAEAIHALDPVRRDKPFITINCAALSKTLAESELFGHGKGAFSGANGERKGLFRAANGGTLMLDEIGELDLDLQPKLLRVLQERRLLPVGEDYEHPIDVRVIAATNRPLDKMIADNKFREDLYQRLNVFRIHLPPLRERPDDVELQARYFLDRYQDDSPKRVIDFGSRVLEVLRSLSWEGNTRQLENCIREALAEREPHGPRFEMTDLPRWVFEKISDAPVMVDAAKTAVPIDQLAEQACQSGLSLSEAVEQYERRLLEKVLADTGGNRTHAAHRLGLTPRTIFAKVKKYQLD